MGLKQWLLCLETWVILDDVLFGLRNVCFLMALGVLIGKTVVVVVVDEASIEPPGPIRMNIWCLNLSRV